MKIILRIIVSPFVLGIVLVFNIYHSFRNTIFFIKYGGEWITYAKKDDKKTIHDLYLQLKEANHTKA